MIPILEKDINECEGSDNCYHISPIPLANESTIVNKNTVLRALGWGAYDETGAQSQFLRQVDLRFNKTYEKDCKCLSYYELFTMVGSNGQDTCSGDSGAFRNIFQLNYETMSY